MQTKNVELKLEKIFTGRMAKINGDTVKISVSRISKFQLLKLSLLASNIKDMNVKRSGTGLTIICTV